MNAFCDILIFDTCLSKGKQLFVAHDMLWFCYNWQTLLSQDDSVWQNNGQGRVWQRLDSCGLSSVPSCNRPKRLGNPSCWRRCRPYPGVRGCCCLPVAAFKWYRLHQSFHQISQDYWLYFYNQWDYYTRRIFTNMSIPFFSYNILGFFGIEELLTKYSKLTLKNLIYLLLNINQKNLLTQCEKGKSLFFLNRRMESRNLLMHTWPNTKLNCASACSILSPSNKQK